MAFSHIISVNGAGNNSGVTTGNINTTGAKIICISVTWYSGGGLPVITDSSGNTWTYLTSTLGGNGITYSCICYCINPTTSATHNFTSTSYFAYSSISVSCFGSSGTPTYDVENSSVAYSGNQTTGCSITPTNNNSLIFTSLGASWGTYPISVNSSFTIGESNDFAAGLNMLNANAYLIQPSIASVTPQFTWTGGQYDVVQTIASFYEVGGANKNKMFFNL